MRPPWSRLYRRRFASDSGAPRLYLQRPDLLQAALTHGSSKRKHRPTTSGSNSSATGCWAWSSPKSSTAVNPRKAEGDMSARYSPLGARRNLRRGGARLRLASIHPASGDRRRRKDCISTRRSWAMSMEALIAAMYLDGGLEPARASSCASGSRFSPKARSSKGRQDLPAGMGAGAGACPFPAIASWRARGRIMRRIHHRGAGRGIADRCEGAGSKRIGEQLAAEASCSRENIRS